MVEDYNAAVTTIANIGAKSNKKANATRKIVDLNKPEEKKGKE